MIFVAKEWIGPKEGTRAVIVQLNGDRKQLTVKANGKLVRTLDLSRLKIAESVVELALTVDNEQRMIRIRVPKEYDLVGICVLSALRHAFGPDNLTDS